MSIRRIDMGSQVAVIIVLYNPDLSSVKKTANRLGRVCSLILVDNSSVDNRASFVLENCQYIPLLENKGIAYAQNVGIDKAKELGCSHVVFFDQDSAIDPQFVCDIVEQYMSIEKTVCNLFLLGPKVYNEKTDEEYRSVFHRYESDENSFQQRREIISSGSCVALKKISDIGGLDNNLFIDAVDFEWCWRAFSKGYVSGITDKVHLKHNVGQREIKICGYSILISAPIRYFYQYRNYMWLCRRSYVPQAWKRNVGVKYFVRLFYFPIFVKAGFKIFKNMLKGISAGFKNDKSIYAKI